MSDKDSVESRGRRIEQEEKSQKTSSFLSMLKKSGPSVEEMRERLEQGLAHHGYYGGTPNTR